MSQPQPTDGQRWVRPLYFPPGSLKLQLPARTLAIGARGDLAELRALLKAHPEYLTKRGNHGRTLLWEAARRGQLPAVKWLLARGAEIDATGCYNNESLVQLTPYAAARYYRRAAVADYLLAAGAQLDVFRAAFLGEQAQVAAALVAEPGLLLAEDPLDDTYYAPLIAFAVAGGQAVLADWLARQGAVIAPYSAQLLQHAGRAGRLDLVRWLLDHGADARAVQSGIFIAVTDVDILRLLLERGASPTRVGDNGFPPLPYVARADKAERPETAALLLDFGAEVDAPGLRGRTALHQAASAGHLDMLRLLLARGASRDVRDEDGATPLDLARANGHAAAARLLRGTERLP